MSLTNGNIDNGDMFHYLKAVVMVQKRQRKAETCHNHIYLIRKIKSEITER